MNNTLNMLKHTLDKKIAVPDLQNTHYDIINITILKLINCTYVSSKKIKIGGIYIVRYVELPLIVPCVNVSLYSLCIKFPFRLHGQGFKIVLPRLLMSLGLAASGCHFPLQGLKTLRLHPHEAVIFCDFAC